MIAPRPGRPRIYCKQSCRQRAHERRKGLGVLPLDLPNTRAVGLILETVRDPAGFTAALAKADAKGVPVVALKIGRTEASARSRSLVTCCSRWPATGWRACSNGCRRSSSS